MGSTRRPQDTVGVPLVAAAKAGRAHKAVAAEISQAQVEAPEVTSLFKNSIFH